MSKKYEAMVLSCMDPRFQKPVHKYLKEKKLTGKFSAFTIAGGSIGVTNEKFKKWHSTFWENLETSINLHKINKLIVINHKDCGAAKIAYGKREFTPANEKKIHKDSFSKIKKQLKKRFPKLKVELNLISLDSKITKF